MGPLDTQNLTKWRMQPSSRHSLLARESMQPWTTTRCHRLLRPLKTHISALRREVDLENPERLGDDAAQDSTSVVAQAKVQHTYSRRGRRVQHTAQPDNLKQSGISRRIVKKKTIQPGEIVLPTPIIRRARGQQLSSPLRQPPLAGPGEIIRCKKHFGALAGHRAVSVIAALESEMQSLRTRITSTKYSLYDAILRALHSLLTATVEPASRPTGAKSLMAMCLRKVPEYIGELEYWEQREAEEQGTKSALQNSEVSGRIYDELQDMLPTSHGSDHLRTVVRAHGVKVIRDSIAEGLFDDNFSMLLVKLCCKTKSYQEGEELLQEFVDRSYPKPKGADSSFDESRKLAPLKALRDFAKESDRPQFMMRQLSKLVSQQLLPPHWLSTKEFASIWSNMVKGLSAKGSCDDSLSFAVHLIASLSTQARTGGFSLRPQIDDLKTLSQQTLLSAITSIATLSILNQEARETATHPTNQERLSTISRRVGYIIHICIYEMRRIRKSSWVSTILKLAAYLTSTTHSRPKEADISEVWCRILANQKCTDRKQEYEAATALISSLAQSCSRGTSQPPHHYLTKLCDGLDQALPGEEPSRKIQVDCAFFLAERTNDLRDLAFAESLDPTGIQHSIQPTPRKESTTSSFSGYRWEEDICEWVVATPKPKQMPRRLSPSPPHTSRSDKDSETFQGPAAEAHDHRVSIDDASSGESEEDSGTQRGSKQRQKCARATSRTVNRSNPPPAVSDGHGVTKRTKRSLEASGLLGLLDDDEEGLDTPSSRGGRGCGSGKENRSVLCTNGLKKRRTTALKPSRAVLKTITNIAHHECSDDELGL
ncbi:hypothetical protein VM1G_00415 [Cytospora mali]|uniref:Uncharacterized protein n=1 Tax=Cytospora mali TaxID=578113 RepID=A0A194VL74_CYTMA|nr:hypothetical protein VM1G_00415 [Valsa mali]